MLKIFQKIADVLRPRYDPNPRRRDEVVRFLAQRPVLTHEEWHRLFAATAAFRSTSFVGFATPAQSILNTTCLLLCRTTGLLRTWACMMRHGEMWTGTSWRITSHATTPRFHPTSSHASKHSDSFLRSFGHMHRNTQPNSPFKNVFFRSSRGNEAHISLETIIRSEPPHVGCYFFNELLRRSSGRWLKSFFTALCPSRDIK